MFAGLPEAVTINRGLCSAHTLAVDFTLVYLLDYSPTCCLGSGLAVRTDGFAALLVNTLADDFKPL